MKRFNASDLARLNVAFSLRYEACVENGESQEALRWDKSRRKIFDLVSKTIKTQNRKSAKK